MDELDTPPHHRVRFELGLRTANSLGVPDGGRTGCKATPVLLSAVVFTTGFGPPTAAELTIGPEAVVAVELAIGCDTAAVEISVSS